MRSTLLAATLVLGMACATSASAVVTTFATFSGADTNLRYVSSGNSLARSNDAVIYTTSTATGTAPGAAAVTFSFVNSALDPFVTNVNARLTINATVAKDSDATTFASFFNQPGISGSFSFITTTGIFISGPGFVDTFYAAGSNLLSGTFGGGDLFGAVGGAAGSASASTSGGDTVDYVSDFFDFSATTDREFSFGLSGVSPVFALGTGDNGALQDFRAKVGGAASSDGAPVPSNLAAAVPEPTTWSLMLAGFGLLGASLRRQRTFARST